MQVNTVFSSKVYCLSGYTCMCKEFARNSILKIFVIFLHKIRNGGHAYPCPTAPLLLLRFGSIK